MFFTGNFRPVGKVVGLYYDSKGNPTKYLKGVEAKAARGAQLMEKQKVEEAKVPNCNSRWNQEDGSEVKVCFTQKVLESHSRYNKMKVNLIVILPALYIVFPYK